MKILKFLAALFFLLSSSALAALPFVTDDAAISDSNDLMLETYTEYWRLPQKATTASAALLGQYLGFSYGLNKNFELTAGGLAAYNFDDDTTSFMNPIFQLKSLVYSPEQREIPSIALSLGYANRNGRGLYYDTANDVYLLAIATSRLFDDNLLLHVNAGPKTSYNLDSRKNLYRMQLGVAMDAALMRKDFRFIAETYNGAPNSPRDSKGYFHSYQVGFRFLKSHDLAFHILYGNQPTFLGYDSTYNETYRRTSWVQFGIRKSFAEIF